MFKRILKKRCFEGALRLTWMFCWQICSKCQMSVVCVHEIGLTRVRMFQIIPTLWGSNTILNIWLVRWRPLRHTSVCCWLPVANCRTTSVVAVAYRRIFMEQIPQSRRRKRLKSRRNWPSSRQNQMQKTVECIHCENDLKMIKNINNKTFTSLNKSFLLTSINDTLLWKSVCIYWSRDIGEALRIKSNSQFLTAFCPLYRCLAYGRFGKNSCVYSWPVFCAVDTQVFKITWTYNIFTSTNEQVIDYKNFDWSEKLFQNISEDYRISRIVFTRLHTWMWWEKRVNVCTMVQLYRYLWFCCDIPGTCICIGINLLLKILESLFYCRIILSYTARWCIVFFVNVGWLVDSSFLTNVFRTYCIRFYKSWYAT